MLKLGAKDIKGLYLGDKEIKKAYIGNALVFEFEKTVSIHVSDISSSVSSILAAGILMVGNKKINAENSTIKTTLDSLTVSYELTKKLAIPRDVIVGGSSLGTVAELGDTVSKDVTMVDGATIEIQFTKAIITYTITATVDPDGYGTVSGAGSHQEGASVTLTATAGDGYKFTAWQENGQTVSTDNPYTFTASGNRAFTAVFAEASRLPAGYTEVEYIKAVNRSCFETGFTLNGQTDRIEVMFTPTTVQTSGSTLYKYYVLNVSSSNYFFIYYQKYYNNTNQSFNWCANSTTSTGITFSPYSLFRNVKRTVVIDFPNKQFDPGINATVSTSCISNTARQLIGLNIGYKTGITSSDTTCSAPASYYSLKVIRGGVSVLDLVPCTDPSGTPGFYDMVGEKFIGNTGAGTPTAGPAV